MAVSDALVSFVAQSHTKPARLFTEIVGVTPTSEHEVGSLVGNGFSGRRHDTAVWILEMDWVESDANPLDEALRKLLLSFDGKQDRVRFLQDDFDLRVSCSATSDSVQGGFWLSAEVLRRLAALGCDLACTVHFDGE